MMSLDIGETREVFLNDLIFKPRRNQNPKKSCVCDILVKTVKHCSSDVTSDLISDHYFNIATKLGVDFLNYLNFEN